MSKTIEQVNGFRVVPVDSIFTTRKIKNRHGGKNDLPVGIVKSQ